MVIDKEERGLYGESPRKENQVFLVNVHALGRIFLLKGAICLLIDI